MLGREVHGLVLLGDGEAVVRKLGRALDAKLFIPFGGGGRGAGGGSRGGGGSGGVGGGFVPAREGRGVVATLHVAAAHGKLGVVEAILSAGGDAKVEDADGRRAGVYARGPHASAIRALLGGAEKRGVTETVEDDGVGEGLEEVRGYLEGGKEGGGGSEVEMEVSGEREMELEVKEMGLDGGVSEMIGRIRELEEEVKRGERSVEAMQMEVEEEERGGEREKREDLARLRLAVVEVEEEVRNALHSLLVKTNIQLTPPPLPSSIHLLLQEEEGEEGEGEVRGVGEERGVGIGEWGVVGREVGRRGVEGGVGKALLKLSTPLLSPLPPKPTSHPSSSSSSSTTTTTTLSSVSALASRVESLLHALHQRDEEILRLGEERMMAAGRRRMGVGEEGVKRVASNLSPPQPPSQTPPSNSPPLPSSILPSQPLHFKYSTPLSTTDTTTIPTLTPTPKTEGRGRRGRGEGEAGAEEDYAMALLDAARKEVGEKEVGEKEVGEKEGGRDESGSASTGKLFSFAETRWEEEDVGRREGVKGVWEE